MANSHADAQTLRGLRAPTNNSSRENDAAQESGSVRRIVLLSTTARDASSQEPNNESTATVFLPSSDISTDPTLPAGWQKIIHDSRLPCYVHETLRLVCWTKPYVLDVMGSSSEFVKVAQQHVPPLSLFKTPADVKSANEAKDNAASAGDCRTERHDKQLVTTTEQSNKPKKRKLKNNSTEQERQQKTQEALAKGQDTQLLSMSIDEFKTLPIGDPRVLQACMELSVKTPAQVLQEYQNRNRGISINYNTIPIERDGVKLFKTIVTAGSSAAEGIATTKKVAKQLGAQSLLAMLHERTAKTYQEVADLYNSVAKSQTTAIESSSSSALVVTAPLQHVNLGAGHYNVPREEGYRRPIDPRANRLAPGPGVGRPPNKKLWRSAPSGGSGSGSGYSNNGNGYNGGAYTGYTEASVGQYLQAAAAGSYPRYGDAQDANQWSGYAQPPSAYYQHPGGAWRPADTKTYDDDATERTERNRIVAYSHAPADSTGYAGAQYYADDASWRHDAGGPGANYQQYQQQHAYAPPAKGALSQYGPPSQQRESSRYTRPGDRLKVTLRSRMDGGV